MSPFKGGPRASMFPGLGCHLGTVFHGHSVFQDLMSPPEGIPRTRCFPGFDVPGSDSPERGGHPRAWPGCGLCRWPGAPPRARRRRCRRCGGRCRCSRPGMYAGRKRKRPVPKRWVQRGGSPTVTPVHGTGQGERNPGSPACSGEAPGAALVRAPGEQKGAACLGYLVLIRVNWS